LHGGFLNPKKRAIGFSLRIKLHALSQWHLHLVFYNVLIESESTIPQNLICNFDCIFCSLTFDLSKLNLSPFSLFSAQLINTWQWLHSNSEKRYQFFVANKLGWHRSGFNAF
jgi:hypothetical protein